MTRIYIVRHAEAEGNLYRRVHGRYDSPVTENGLRQIAALEQRFQDIPVDAVYSSPLRRPRQTAMAVAGPKHLEIQVEPGLIEMALGDYEDMTFGDFTAHHGEEFRQFVTCSPLFSPPGGETFAQVAARVKEAFFRIAKENDGKTVALFSHGTAIQSLQAALRGLHPADNRDLGHPENTAVSCYEVEGDRVSILFENDASHITDDISTMKRQGKHGRSPLVWFRLPDMDRESQLYYDARRDAWQDLHGSLAGFDGEGFLAEARDQWFLDHRAVQLVMAEDQTAGLLHLATGRDAAEGVGYIPFLYLSPAWRGKRVGDQVLGQAIYTYRAMGRQKLRLRCAQDNLHAQHFYARHGFRKTGEAPGSHGTLDILEKDI